MIQDIKVTMNFGSKELYDLGMTVDEKGQVQLLGSRIIERDEMGKITRDEYLPPAVIIVYENEDKNTFFDKITDFLGLN